MEDHPRLSAHQIAILRSLATRGAVGRPITLLPYQRTSALPLWRREIVEIWYRQSTSGLQGPFYGLTITGALMASMFIRITDGAKS